MKFFNALVNSIRTVLVSRKRVFIVLSICIVIMLVAVFRIIAERPIKSALFLDFPVNTAFSSLPLTSLDRNAARAKIRTVPGYAYFRFSRAQSAEISAEYEKDGDAALSLTISQERQEKNQVSVSASKPFVFGFLYKEDFKSKFRLMPKISKRSLVTAELNDFAGADSFTLSFCFPKVAEELPVGFFVYSTEPVSLRSAQIVRASVGWDKLSHFYSFTSYGGSVSTIYNSADFIGASSVFPVKNTETTIMPQIHVGFLPCENAGTYDNQEHVELTVGGEKIFVRRIKKQTSAVFPAAAFVSPFSQVEVTKNAAMVTSLLMTQSPRTLLPASPGHVLCPYKCDPGLVINWNSKNWRTDDYELFEWHQFPKVLIFDTKNYKVQQDFFRRLAFYVEKTGFRGKLLTEKQLGDAHGYNAHDYSADSLASFYAAAEKEHFTLNEKEYLLRDILLANGVIVRGDDGVLSPGTGAVISISQESALWLRRRFVAHEGWHAIFFTNAGFRNTVAAVYYTIDPSVLLFLGAYWKSQNLNYDPEDTYLMHNEFMAYLMQQTLSQTSAYFLHAAERPSVRQQAGTLADYVIRTHAAAFEDAATVLNDYAFDNWGLAAGRIWLVSR